MCEWYNMMEFIQLNQKWNADPNAPYPCIKINGSNLLLSFFMNHFTFSNYNDSDMGVIEFYDCIQYRLGEPNDEGFYLGQCRYKQYGIKWGEFYLVRNSDWEVNFPNPKILNKTISTNQVNHYLFYFRDETFECVAESYKFSVNPNFAY